MTPKEADKILEECIDAFEKQGVDDNVIMALTFGLVGNRRRIPLKPFDIKELAHDCAIGRCPCCANGVNAAMDYCDQCGQCLDWTEEKEKNK